jgi:hypothetical protein
MSIEAQIRSAADALVARLTDDFRQQVSHAVGEIATVASAADSAQADALRATLEAAHAEAVEALRTEHAQALEQLRSDHAAALEASDHARVEALQTVRAEADSALAQAEEALAEAVRQAEQRRAAAYVESSQLARHEAAERLGALARAVAAMDDAESLSDVLDALAEGLASQAVRSVVLVLKGETARVWRRVGFDTPLVEVGEELALDEHADLKALVESAAPVSLEGRGDQERLLGVATLPEARAGLAVPVAIGGQVAALAYADAGDSTVQPFPGWGDLVEVLARHAARCLEALTAMRASGYARPQRPAVVVPMPPHLKVVERQRLDESMGDALAQAQRVARLLVSEIRLNREDEIREGREAGDLGDRLGPDIARARSEYLSRVPPAVPGREALFEEEVVRTLAGGNADLLLTGS